MNLSEQSSQNDFEQSLADFYQMVVAPRLGIKKNPTILELGSGNCSLFEKMLPVGAAVTAVDISASAIAVAPQKTSIHYLQRNITQKHFLGEGKDEKFDLIFDSHCLHCILEKTQRDRAFKNIYYYLKEGGLFCAEMMVQSKKTPQTVLRYIPAAHELEAEIIGCGLKIIYFVIAPDLVFQLDEESKSECDLLRIVATK